MAVLQQALGQQQQPQDMRSRMLRELVQLQVGCANASPKLLAPAALNIMSCMAQEQAKAPNLDTLQELIGLGGPDLQAYKDKWVQGSMHSIQQHSLR